MTFDLNDFLCNTLCISCNTFLGCIKHDECPSDKPECRGGKCIKGLLQLMSEDGEEDNFIFTQSYVLIQKPATMMVIALKKNPYVEIEIAEVCYVIYQSWGEG